MPATCRLMGVPDRSLHARASPLSDVSLALSFLERGLFRILFAVVLGRRSLWWAIGFAQLIGIGFLLSPAVKALGIGFMGLDMPTMPLTVAIAHLAYGLLLGLFTRRWLLSHDWLLRFRPAAA
jgi:hypothetical protein